MLVQGQSGPIYTGNQSLSPGAPVPLRQGNLGDTIVSELHGRCYETNYRKMLFSGGISGTVNSYAVNASYNGLVLSNPIGSAVNLVLQKCGWSFIGPTTSASTGIVGLMTGYNVNTPIGHTTPVPTKPAFIGTNVNSVGLLDTSANLPVAPTFNTVLGAILTGINTTIPYVPPTIYDMEGSIILPPGAFCAFYMSSSTNTQIGNFSFTWEEIPI